MSYYFVIVGTGDTPLYEAQLTSARFPVPAPLPSNVAPAATFFDSMGISVFPGDRHVKQLIAHASLDLVDEIQWTTSMMYLKSVDRFQEWQVSCWVTPGGTRFVILWDTKNDDGMRNFLHEAWEAYVKILLNPFREATAPITSKSFDRKIRTSAKKHL